MATIKSLNDIPAVASYLSRIGAEPRGLKTAVVKVTAGRYWKDVGKVVFDSGKVSTQRPEDAPTENEQLEIDRQWGDYNFPKRRVLKNDDELKIVGLPNGLTFDSPNLFIFRDTGGRVTMLQERNDTADGNKSYYPWTYWSDGEWRMCEPDAVLPLWGLDQLKHYNTVFIHEGARAARTCAEMVARKKGGESVDHPWIDHLCHSAHLGWISGALSPGRTDWSELRKAGVTRAIIVADNDWEGKGAVPAISQRLSCPTFRISFTNEFPTGFDLHDPFPEDMWSEDVYVGPTFNACLQPATWATKKIPNESGKGAPIIVLRDCFKGQWAYVAEANVFVCKAMPQLMFDSETLNRYLAPFSHSKNVVGLILKEQREATNKLAYRPDVDSRSGKLSLIQDDMFAINIHVASDVKGISGDMAIFDEFMEYLIPKEWERNFVRKWIATLISRPHLRMKFGLLMCSEMQGVGKTTLAYLLEKVIGAMNCSFPSEESLLSQFNGWLAHKRLIIVNEIYTGASWRSYNKLKSAMTDRKVEVNKKFMREYDIENWAHFYACSNSVKPLKMDEKDRRWFYPELAEYKWKAHKYNELYEWINGPGPSRLKAWADTYGNYFTNSCEAEMTDRKRGLISASLDEWQEQAVRLGNLLSRSEDGTETVTPRVASTTGCRSFILERISQRKVHATDHQLRKAVLNESLNKSRLIYVDGKRQNVIYNNAAGELLEQCISTKDEANKLRELCASTNLEQLDKGETF